jgi:hypothetical protein
VVAPRHEILKKLHGYWLAKKQHRLAPARTDIDPAELRHMLPYLFMVDVENRPLRYRFRLVGTAIVSSFGLDITGRYLDEVGFRVVATGEPSCHQVHFTRGNGRFLAYERLILPLSSDGRSVDMLLGGICFDEAYETDFSSSSRRASV